MATSVFFDFDSAMNWQITRLSKDSRIRLEATLFRERGCLQSLELNLEVGNGKEPNVMKIYYAPKGLVGEGLTVETIEDKSLKKVFAQTEAYIRKLNK